jgi:hypothetical protein
MVSYTEVGHYDAVYTVCEIGIGRYNHRERKGPREGPGERAALVASTRWRGGKWHALAKWQACYKRVGACQPSLLPRGHGAPRRPARTASSFLALPRCPSRPPKSRELRFLSASARAGNRRL